MQSSVIAGGLNRIYSGQSLYSLRTVSGADEDKHQTPFQPKFQDALACQSQKNQATSINGVESSNIKLALSSPLSRYTCVTTYPVQRFVPEPRTDLVSRPLWEKENINAAFEAKKESTNYFLRPCQPTDLNGPSAGNASRLAGSGPQAPR
ncbi:uncharacterized protein BKA78DRAFT_305218 [Phyllosticta capitalensis]|uniref:uncharacterized protein n=1 Tax=Phyllosticta capitalensis TaxID=121624 RepID=UPI00312F19CD